MVLYAMWSSKYVVVVGSIVICLVVLAVGMNFSDGLIKGRFDISYGLYLYAFPIQQLLINKSGLGFSATMLLSIVLTVLAATLSWLFVEKPILRLAHKKSVSRRSKELSCAQDA